MTAPDTQLGSRMVERTEVRNIAIIAHVDHGKTTLIDGMLKQSRVFREGQAVGELILDSNALEREKGITILAKNTAVRYRGTRINVIDTPGHADFSGEVERVLNMADGCLLLVDSVEGPMPQTRFVLKKALDLGLKPIVVVNKIDRANARIAEVLEATQDLFLELATDAEQLDFEVVYTNARAGTATLDPAMAGSTLEPLFETILSSIPCPHVDVESGFQMLVSNIRYNEYLGRNAVGRIARGRIRAGDNIVRIDENGASTRQRSVDVFAFEGLETVPCDEARAGDIVLLTGLDEVNIGDTIASAESPEALPRLDLEPPTVRVTIGVNTSPFAGRDGTFVTSRQLRARLYRELETNIALRVDETESADQFLVSGRGELHLAILIETLRREGYEFQVSRPQVIPRTIDGVLKEPVEHVVIETTEESIGPVTEELSVRAGRLVNHQSDGSGRVRLEYAVPTRGLIGLRGIFLTLTRGEGLMSSVVAGYEPMGAPIGRSRNGALVATNTGVSTTYGLNNAQERGETFIEPGLHVYEGMVVGVSRYPQDVPINVCKEKKQTNIRSSTSDIAIRLSPPIVLSLEDALAWIGDDELVEVTPKSMRLRKRLLSADDRLKARKDQGSR
ncbi:MAG TPA: translational GTPase TypA [Chloroflexota bacterium]|nr:translational GTPase TypA [Chloroflexota bacterium]